MERGSEKYEAMLSYLKSCDAGAALAPLPAELIPTSTDVSIFADMDDETLLNASPTMLAHLERTAACGGVQIMGPEAVACNEVLARVAPTERQADLVVAGSVASPDLGWPTYDGRKLDAMWTYEPYESARVEPGVRGTLRKEGIAGGVDEKGDPVLDALAKAVGIVELQRHEGVSGDASKLADLYEDAWGLTAGTFEEFSRCTVAPSGDLLRYALGSEKDISVANMPVQSRRTISVHIGPQDRTDFGDYRAVNWGRQRVLAEAIMYMTSRSEGLDMISLAKAGPPGDVALPITREGILVFQPASLAVFSYPPETFRIDVRRQKAKIKRPSNMPKRVQEIVREYVKKAVELGNPVGERLVSTSVTTKSVVTLNPSRDTIIAASMDAISAGARGLSRGRDTAKVLRGHIAKTFDAALDHTTKVGFMSSVVFMREIKEICSIKTLSLNNLEITRAFIPMLTSMAHNVRASLAAEAAMRGETIESWFSDAVTTVPMEIRPTKEGTAAWMTIAAWDIVSGRNQKWAGLLKHLSAKSVSETLKSSIRHAVIAGQYGTVERLRNHVAHVGVRNAVEWSAYYQPTARAAHEITKKYYGATTSTWCAQNARGAIKLGGLLWELRSRIAATLSTKLIVYDDYETAQDEYKYEFHESVYGVAVKVEFHKQWAAFIGSLRAEGAYHHAVVTRLAVSMPKGWLDNPSGVWGTRKLPGPTDLMGIRVCRYVASPSRFWEDIGKLLRLTAQDAESPHTAYTEHVLHEAELRGELEPGDVVGSVPQDIIEESLTYEKTNTRWQELQDMMSSYTRKNDGYTILSERGVEGQAILETIENDMEEDEASDLLTAVYSSYEELLSAYNDMMDDLEEGEEGEKDAIY